MEEEEKEERKPGRLTRIAGYLGKDKNFDTAIANYAMTYADQAERDYQLLVEAVASGQVVAAKGI